MRQMKEAANMFSLALQADMYRLIVAGRRNN
jgi:hypothetical protein